MKKIIFLLAFVGILATGAFLGYHYYSYLFAKVIDGRVVGVNRTQAPGEEYVVAMRKSGEREVLTAKTDDPRWALVTPGQCAQAKFFPHPPWNLNDGGTYFRATVLVIRDCTESDGPAPAQAAITSAEAPSAAALPAAAAAAPKSSEAIPETKVENQGMQ